MRAPSTANTYAVAVNVHPSVAAFGVPITFSALFVNVGLPNGSFVQGGVPPYNYTWRFDDGSSVIDLSFKTSDTVNHSFSCPNFHRATVWVNDSQSNSSWASGYASIIPAYEAWLNATPAIVAVGSASQLSLDWIGAVAPVSVAWAGLPSPCTGENAASVRCSPSVPGTFNVTANLTDARGCVAQAVTILGAFEQLPPNHVVAPPWAPWFAPVGTAVLLLSAALVTVPPIRSVLRDRSGRP